MKEVERQFNKANTLFSEALKETEVERRKELLEQAFRAYVDILPLLQGNEESIMLIRRAVLEKIHVIEALIEQEIVRSVISNSSKKIEEVLTRLQGID